MVLAWKPALTLAAALALAGCQSTGGALFASRGSPAGVPIAFESIDGAPPAVRSALDGELAAAASARQVDLVGAGAEARYRVRGYLSTEETADGGVALAFVWDVFDGAQRRAQRITGSSPISPAFRRQQNDPWEGLDKAALARLAARSMDEIANFLSASASGVPAAATPLSTALPDAG